MRFVLFLMGFTAALSAHAVDEAKPRGFQACHQAFTAVPLIDYLTEAQRHVVSAATLRDAEHHMLKYIYELIVNTKPSSSVSSLLSLSVVQNYSGALTTRVRGLNRRDAGFEQALSAELGIPLKTIQFSTRLAADDPKIYRNFGMAEFILQRAPSIEDFLLTSLMKDQLSKLETITFERNGETITTPFIAGPRQVEMVRTVLQYTLTTPGDNVLEIGYGTPAVALAVAYYTRTNVTAIDPISHPANANKILAPHRVELVHGNFPIVEKATSSIQKRAPYKIIYALDVIRKTGGILSTRLSPRAFARSIYNLLADGGTVVIMNDFMDQPFFSKEDATAEGLDVIRWRFKQAIPENLLKLMPNRSHPDSGNMAVYVLRKGEPDTSQGRMMQTSMRR